MNGLISAIRFITILPIGKSGRFSPEEMIQFFPVVGMILGVFLAIADQIFLQLWSVHVASILDVVLLIVLTGAFHIDGLGDTADGLLGHRTKAKALEIMKDSRIGVMGLAAVLCILLIKLGGLMNLGSHRALLIVIIPAYARSSMLFGIKCLKYGRPSGTAHAFFEGPLPYSSFWGLCIPVVLSLFLGGKGIWLNMVFIIITFGIILYYKKRMDAITGDMLGAMTEMIEAMLFLTASAGSGI